MKFYLIVLSFYSFAISASVDAIEIMGKNEKARLCRNEKTIITMTLINKKGHSRSKKIDRISFINDKDEQKVLLKFLAPADAKGIGILVHENSNADSDRWIYLPVLKKSRRITANKKSDTFMGSDFTFEDLEREQLSEFSYTYNGDTLLGSLNCHIVTSIPKSDETLSNSGYSRRILFINTSNFMIQKIDYYNKKGILFKCLDLSDIRFIENVKKWRSHKMQMNNLETGHKTILEFSDFDLESSIDETIFTLRYLERGI